MYQHTNMTLGQKSENAIFDIARYENYFPNKVAKMGNFEIKVAKKGNFETKKSLLGRSKGFLMSF